MAGTMAGLFPDSGIGAALDKLYAARTWQAARPALAQSQYRQRGAIPPTRTYRSTG